MVDFGRIHRAVQCSTDGSGDRGCWGLGRPWLSFKSSFVFVSSLRAFPTHQIAVRYPLVPSFRPKLYDHFGTCQLLANIRHPLATCLNRKSFIVVLSDLIKVNSEHAVAGS